MRILLFLALALVACDRSGANSSQAAAATAPASKFVGPDALFLRIPRAGGPLRVVAYPNVDSTVWTSSAASPPPGRILGFDDDAGVVAMVDTKSRPITIDFRRDSIEGRQRRESVSDAVSIDGSTIFGVTAKGAVVRITPAGEWTYGPGAHRARGALPLRDGSVLLWSDRDSHALLTRLRPPGTAPIDSLAIPLGKLSAGTGIGDRLYFVDNDQLYAVQTRTLQLGPPLDAGGTVTALAVTPSGDRIYALTTKGERSTLVAIDRYRWRVTSRLQLDLKATELRVDPIGRFILMRGAKDSVAVVTVANNQVLGTIHSDWRDDLPLVAPDGSIATVRDRDVVFVRPEDQSVVTRVAHGASDLWFAFWWTGFRPRAAALDVPVTFDSLRAITDSATTAVVVTIDTGVRAVVTAGADTETTKSVGYTVSFFALLSQQRAQTEAANIRVGNDVAHVETVMRAGVPVYRVILGPYPTCADAQRAAKASGKTAWIPEGGCTAPPPENEPLAR